MEKKGAAGVTTFAILRTKVIIGIIAIGVMSVCGYVFSNQEDATYDDYEENCGDIWCIKSIVVKDDSILIEFDTSSGGFQVVGMIAENGTVNPLEYGSTFSVKIGEKIAWGDGDHVFASIKLEDIKDNVAFIIIGNEHRPPLGFEKLGYKRFRKCKIYSE